MFKRLFSSVQTGPKYSSAYKNYLKLDNGKIGSYMHDIPIEYDQTSGLLNVVVEIPRWTNAKFEISRSLEANPITQDQKDGQLRFVHNLYPNHGFPFNYGAIPQTWEDYTRPSKFVSAYKGDNDPLDIIEVGSKVLEVGQVLRVKVLGSLALIDEGELDWKIITINTEDYHASDVNDIYDIYHVLPGMLENTREWFKNYKKPEGKPSNVFAFNGEFKNHEDTMKVIEECHKNWKALIKGKVTGAKAPKVSNATLEETPGFTTFDEQKLLVKTNAKDEAIPQEVNRLYFFNN
ncbi:hypothetical protein LJB42_000679 [Komagataella kurtzmanii]|nr:hypothetical protein LJB42_000679 [Komagataella kurtzmanii]